LILPGGFVTEIGWLAARSRASTREADIVRSGWIVADGYRHAGGVRRAAAGRGEGHGYRARGFGRHYRSLSAVAAGHREVGWVRAADALA
jgi:hypothetical protein